MVQPQLPQLGKLFGNDVPSTPVIVIPRGSRLDVAWEALPGPFATVVMYPRNGGESITLGPTQYPFSMSFDGDMFSSVSLSQTGAGTESGFIWALVSRDSSPVFRSLFGSITGVFVQNSPTVSIGNFPSTFPRQPSIYYNGTTAAPITGTWRGYAVAGAAGVVSIEVSGVTITLGSATEAGQSFAFTLGIGATMTPTLTNCSIGGGILEP